MKFKKTIRVASKAELYHPLNYWITWMVIKSLKDHSKDKASKDKTSKDKTSKDKASKDKASKDKASKDKASKDKSSKDKSSKDKVSKDKMKKNVSRRKLLDLLSIVFSKGRKFINANESIYELPDLDEAFGNDPDMRSVSHYIEADKTGFFPKRISRKVERLRILTLFVEIEFPHVAKHYIKF
ncbi:MAG: hypothetical protein V4629_02350 [Pseudomonadota bacterium]